MMDLQRLASQFSFNPIVRDTRSLDQYIDAVDKWAERLKTALRGEDGLLAHYLEQEHGVVRFRAENRTDGNETESEPFLKTVRGFLER